MKKGEIKVVALFITCIICIVIVSVVAIFRDELSVYNNNKIKTEMVNDSQQNEVIEQEDKYEEKTNGFSFVKILLSLCLWTFLIWSFVGIYKALLKLEISGLLIASAFILPVLPIILRVIFVFTMWKWLLTFASIVEYISYVFDIILLSELFDRVELPRVIALLPVAAVLLAFIPFMSIVIMLILLYYSIRLVERMAEKFNKGKGYAVGMFFLPYIYISLLGYSKNT